MGRNCEKGVDRPDYLIVIRRRISGWILLLIIWGLGVWPEGARGEIDSRQFGADLGAICACGSRVVGSAGYYEAGKYLEGEMGKLPGVEVQKHEFAVMTPVTEWATLSMAGGRVENVYPFWPAQIRTCTTPVEGISGKVVYAGECRYEELKPASLYGQIAVIEASAGGRWPEVFYQGARAALVLGNAQTSWVDLKEDDLRIPVNFPRFYVPPGELADELRGGRIGWATIKASVKWERRVGVNYYALVKGKKKGAALVFSVPLDSTSLVPDLSPGASQAVQTAAGLGLVRDLAKHPWGRPVVVFFSGADGIQFLGTRNMLMALGSPTESWGEQVGEMDANIGEVKSEIGQGIEARQSLQELSGAGDRGLVGRILEIVDADALEVQDRLFRLRNESGANGEEIAKLADEQQQLNRLRAMFRDSPGELSQSGYAAEAREYIDRAIARLKGRDDRVSRENQDRPSPQPSPGVPGEGIRGVEGDSGGDGLVQEYAARKGELERRVELHRWLAGAEGVKQNGGLIELLVGLDLSDRGYRVGPMSFGYFQRAGNGAMGEVSPFTQWMLGRGEDFANQVAGSAWWGKVGGEIDLGPLRGLRSANSFLAGPLPLGSEMAFGWGVPGLSMVTLDDLRLRRDTPTDTLDRIDVGVVVGELNGVRDLFAHAWSDPAFRGQGRVRQLNAGFMGQVVSASAGRPVPDLPREGFVATYSYILNGGVDQKIPPLGAMPWVLGIRRTEVQACDSLGEYRFEGLPQFPSDVLVGPFNATNDMQTFAVNVYRIDPSGGEITATTDYGRQAEDIKWSADIKQEVPPLRSLPFDCEEYSLSGLYDPRFLQTLGAVSVLDARRGAEAEHYSVWLDNKMAAGFSEPGARSDLLVRYGAIGNRLILVNVPPSGDGEGRGYTAEELNGLGPLALATARDFYRLDDARLENYRRAGVSSRLVDELHRDAGEELGQAQEAQRGDDGVALMRSATGAWANEARVYDAAQAMARDVVRAAIFLLMICVPFSFCMERLLIASPNVYRQLAGMGAIFAVMTGALWTFHPAFKISASPLMIVLAFAIIFMSGLVIVVLYQKFDAELKRMRTGRVAASGASFGRMSVLMSAVLLGIANMRRRKFRTLLTSVTIVLITFVVLWFTSTSRFLGTTTVATGVASSHRGIMLRQRGFRPIPEMMADQLRAVLADPALKLDKTRVVERWWAVSADPQDEYDIVVGDGGHSREFGVPGILGLSPGEGEVSRAAEVIGADKFARLEKGELNIAYMSGAMAAKMGVREGDRICLDGIELEVAGIFSADAFDEEVLSLDGQGISPLKYSAGELDPGGQSMDDSSAQSLELSGGAASAEAGVVYEHLSATDFVIVPSGLCRRLMNSSLRTVAIRLNSEEEVKAVSDEVARRFVLATYAGYDDGVRMVAAGNLMSISGTSQVAIPLLIAALIIFNTMMGATAERKREIHVYTSMGLAPMHVGALFVAEAMTYGLIGTVFGYVIGQGIGSALLKLGWLGTITLNYSGSSAIMTMGLILAVVFVSALVPARVASKIAAPSIERTWKVPAAMNDEIRAVLPFTINRTAAEGALAYIAEYLELHREGSIGKFASDRVDPVAYEETGGSSRALKTTVWLTPYDLGIRQQMLLLIHPGADKDIYEVEVRLRRQSGDDGSWHRMNKTFLTELRKQFLQWRSLTPARMLEYVEQSKRLFGTPAGV